MDYINKLPYQINNYDFPSYWNEKEDENEKENPFNLNLSQTFEQNERNEIEPDYPYRNGESDNSTNKENNFMQKENPGDNIVLFSKKEKSNYNDDDISEVLHRQFLGLLLFHI